MANGLFGGGDGTASNPYLVEDSADLNAVRNNLTAHYKQVNDIDMLNVSFTPIGTTTNITKVNGTEFSGSYNGEGKNILNLTFIDTTKQSVGMFGAVLNGIIRSVVLINPRISANAYVGGVVGFMSNTTVEYCTVLDGNITATGDNIGGIVGYIYNQNGTVLSSIKHCFSSTTLGNVGNTTNRGSGGIVGGVSGTSSASALSEISYNISACINLGTSTTRRSGCIGSISTGVTAYENYFDREIIGFSITNDGSPVYAYGKTTKEMKGYSIYQAFKGLKYNGLDIWSFNDGEYPTLWYLSSIRKILLLSNEKTYSMEKGGFTDNIIPEMTSSSTPNGVVECSSQNSSYQSFNAFNSSETSNWLTNSSKTGWISYQFTSAKVVSRYRLRNSNISRCPKDFTFEGWNGSQWILLDTRTNITDWAVNTYKEFDFVNNNNYIKYRLNVTANNGDGTYLGLNSFQMCEKLPSKINQIPSTVEQNFINYGINSPIQVDGIFESKNYILQDTVSEDTDGLWKTQITRKPLSISFN